MASYGQNGTEKTQGELGYVRVANEIRRMILSNEFEPGEWIRVKPLTERLGVSAQPIREALQHLQGEGLLELVPNRGAQVRGITLERLVQIYEIRAALESYMARRFSERAGYLDLQALKQAQAEHDKAIAARDLDRTLKANSRFHEIINSHGNNREILDHINRNLALTRAVRTRVGYDQDYFRRVSKEHHGLLEAFEAHDANAAAERGLKHVLRSLDEVARAYFGVTAPPYTPA